MFKKILVVLVVLIALTGFYFGTFYYLEKKAEAEETITYTVMKTKNSEYGYVPYEKGDISKPTLEAYIVLSWWEASWLDNGNLMIKFEADADKTWFVEFEGNDSEIEVIRNLVEHYGLKCSIPD